jgi:hypothetical protein
MVREATATLSLALPMLYTYAFDSNKKSSDNILRGETIVSIEKKSLISTLKTTKKANIAGAPVVESGKEKVSSQKDLKMRTAVRMRYFKSNKAV